MNEALQTLQMSRNVFVHKKRSMMYNQVIPRASLDATKMLGDVFISGGCPYPTQRNAVSFNLFWNGATN